MIEGLLIANLIAIMFVALYIYDRFKDTGKQLSELKHEIKDKSYKVIAKVKADMPAIISQQDKCTNVTGLQGKLPEEITDDLECVPIAYVHQADFLRKLIKATSTKDIAVSVKAIIDTLVEQQDLGIHNVSILQWSDKRKEMRYMGTNVANIYTKDLLKHINEIHSDTLKHGLAAYVNTKNGVLDYETARERNVSFEYYIPLYRDDTLIGAVYIESRDEACKAILDLQFLQLIIENISLIIYNIQLMHSVLRQTNIDGLTKLYNRNYMDVYLKTLDTANLVYDILMIDIDYFKSINDNYGHTVGDLALQSLANLLKANVREGQDAVFRFGGEEFLIVLLDADLDLAKSRCEHIRKQVAELKVDYAPDTYIQFTISAGIAASQQGIAAKETVEQADKALYCAKESGRNRTVLFTEINSTPIKGSTKG